MDLLRFDIEAEPVPASRPKVSKFGAYYPQKHTAYANFLGTFLNTVTPIALSEPVEVRLLFVMPRYKTSSALVHRADVDNLAKLPLDCMTKCFETGTKTHRFWPDDSLVTGLIALKRFVRDGEEPHTKVRVIKIETSVEDHVDRLFNA